MTDSNSEQFQESINFGDNAEVRGDVFTGGKHIYYGEPSDPNAPGEQEYLRAVAEAYRYLALEGSDHRIPLTDVFVMLQAAKIRPRRDVELTEQRQTELGSGLPARTGERTGWRIGEQKHNFFARLGLESNRQEETTPLLTLPAASSSPPEEVSTILSQRSRLVILGEPGGGKTTLLRFIALCLTTPRLAQAKLKLYQRTS